MVSFLKKGEDYPPVEYALKEPNGLLAVGGDLSINSIIRAYKKGIFPWFNEDEPICWYSPDPRMIITPKSVIISKRIKRKLNKFNITINKNFSQVIRYCASIKRKNQNGTWINSQMIPAYEKLYKINYAMSVEVFKNQELVGGLYGVIIKEVFFGESMFSKTSDASKLALIYLLTKAKIKLIDCQTESEHLKNIGAFCISRQQFIQILQKLI